MKEENLSNKYIQKKILHRNKKIIYYNPFKDQMITRSRRYYNETETKTLP